MGFRNPFRMSVDKATGIVYLGDYGPDAGAADPNRGPGGQVEFDRITGPGNYGWPYCTGNNDAVQRVQLRHRRLRRRSTTAPAARPTTRSATPACRPAGGQAGLDPVRRRRALPEFGGGSESPMGGPVYRYNAALNSPVKFPQALDGRYFAGEYGRRWIKAIAVNADGTGQISPFPWTGTQVMDMAFGPDGALYVLDYGTG